MAFEILEQDLAGRIGKLETPRGVLETPLIFPVVNPTKLTIPPKELASEFRCPALITNAYFLWQKCQTEVLEQGVHALLDFPGAIMTDSGAYQILMYGDVEIAPKQVLEFQRHIGSDLGVILDIPTGANISRSHAESTVEQTIERAREAISYWAENPIDSVENARQEPIWVGPIQGGIFTDLVKASGKAMTALGFQAFALGSPTPLLEQYRYPELIQMIIAARTSIPHHAPLHLFGAGHPMILPLAVALGCDFFDSAAYALFAQQGRYLTPYETLLIEHIENTDCLCPICREYLPQELAHLDDEIRTEKLARHNLYVTLAELSATKQAIRDGRLWEYIQRKAVAHPMLLEATRRLQDHALFLEENTPVMKNRAIRYTGPLDFFRPETIRHHQRLQNWQPLRSDSIMIYVTPDQGKIGLYARPHRQLLDFLNQLPSPIQDRVSILTLSVPFGVIPFELSGVYPLTQHVPPPNPDDHEWTLASETIIPFTEKRLSHISALVLFADWPETHPVVEKLRELCNRHNKELHLLLEPSPSTRYQREHITQFKTTIQRFFDLEGK